MLPLRKILWPTDASDSALRALDAAIVMASQFNAKIFALQVVDQIARPNRAGFAGDPIPFDFPLYEQHMAESARTNLQEVLTEKVPSPIKTEVHVELGSPRETIHNFCRTNAIDLIVMATHGRGGMAHLLLGSVAEATIRQSQVPVLVIPWKEAPQGT